MTMKKTLLSVLIAAGTIGALATPLTSVAGVDVELNFGPPPVRYEFVPEPRYGYAWAPGYWEWRGHRHVWVDGRMIRGREGYAYHPHRWMERDGRWQFERGRWEHARYRDSDGDGVPDRFDRAPYNPYRH